MRRVFWSWLLVRAARGLGLPVMMTAASAPGRPWAVLFAETPSAAVSFCAQVDAIRQQVALDDLNAPTSISQVVN